MDCTPSLGPTGAVCRPTQGGIISPAQAVFGTPIVLPGQFLNETAKFYKPDFYKNFSQSVGPAEIIPARHNVARAQSVPEDLHADLLHGKAALVRRNGHLPPLELLYDIPYCVLTRSCNFFWLQIGGRADTAPVAPS
jgi:hypothetical protein